MAKEPERRKKSAEEKRKKLEKRRSEPKHHFNDTSYMDQIRSTEENIDTALQQGLQAAASSTSTKKIIPESSGNRVTKIWYVQKCEVAVCVYTYLLLIIMFIL